MMFLFGLLIFLFSVASAAAPGVTLKFDDIYIDNSISIVELVQPYHGYVLKRINTPYTGYIDFHLPVLNVSSYELQNPSNLFFHNAPISQPNIIFTTGENLNIVKSNGKKFSFLSVCMTSIFMPVMMTGFRNGKLVGSKTINLRIKYPLLISPNWGTVDNVTIGCTNPDPSTCAHIGYDNFVFI